MGNIIGLDVGGTNIRAGILDDHNTLIDEFKIPNLYNKDNLLIDKMIDIINEYFKYSIIDGIGLSIAGSVSPKGKVVTARNLGSIVDYPIKDILNRIYDVPVIIENDAKLAAYGEAVYGGGRAYKNVCYITISTGLGGGVVIDKEIYMGSSNLGGYIPRIYLDGEHTSDELLSGRALLHKAKELISVTIRDVEELFVLYEQGNKAAIEIIEEFKHYLTILLLNITATFNPDIIILGGGIVKSKDLFLTDVLKEYYIKVHILANNTFITTQTLEEPGLIGACGYCKKRINKINKDEPQ